MCRQVATVARNQRNQPNKAHVLLYRLRGHERRNGLRARANAVRQGVLAVERLEPANVAGPKSPSTLLTSKPRAKRARCSSSVCMGLP